MGKLLIWCLKGPQGQRPAGSSHGTWAWGKVHGVGFVAFLYTMYYKKSGFFTRFHTQIDSGVRAAFLPHEFLELMR
jgi:hypothetical protein